MSTQFYRRKFTPALVTGKIIDYGTLWMQADTVATLTTLWMNGHSLPLTDLDTGQFLDPLILVDGGENVVAAEITGLTIEFRVVFEYKDPPTAAVIDTNIGPGQQWVVRNDTSGPETFMTIGPGEYTTFLGNQPRGKFFNG
jgi:hypothetical protein